MAIKLKFTKTDRDLTGCSKIWGCPDLPDCIPYPMVNIQEQGELIEDPMTFLCQIRLEDIASLDTESQLPHEGMLYFFASLDYFLGNLDALVCPGMGEWDSSHFRVLYSPFCEELHSHRIVYNDGSDYGLPAEEISFEECAASSDGFKLLGLPYYEEVQQEYPGWTSLFQMDESDEWGLRFFDCGMLSFLTDFKKVRCYLHSF